VRETARQVGNRPPGESDGERRGRAAGPPLPDGLEEVKLADEVRRDLLGLRKEVAEDVSRHLVAAGSLLDDDPERALAHARYARGRASRLAVVREAVGLAAYRAGEWAEAIAELRAARRMGGGPGHLAVLADCERALGRPERALELARSPEVAELDEAEAVELRIVAAGARRDMGDTDAAVVSLQIPELDSAHRRPWSARLFYAYADALLAAGRRDEAVRWFLHAADVDDDELTDAADRLTELTEPGERSDVTVRDERPEVAVRDERPEVAVRDERPEVAVRDERPEVAVPDEHPEVAVPDEHPEFTGRQPSPTSASGPVS
jgi:tetratricopeptide (TPR) repeat protein